MQGFKCTILLEYTFITNCCWPWQCQTQWYTILVSVSDDQTWQGKIFVYNIYLHQTFNMCQHVHPMRTTYWLVKQNILSFIKPIRESVRKLYPLKVYDTTSLKPFHNWLNRWIFHDIDQSELIVVMIFKKTVNFVTHRHLTSCLYYVHTSCLNEIPLFLCYLHPLFNPIYK